jgi:curved DNA-binding protein CbpA
MSRDPYIVLGLTRQASRDEIARAYRRAARTSHPDSGGDGSPERFQAVSDAYEMLRDPRRRATYDRAHPPAVNAQRGSVRYAGPGSQHVVLGRPANDRDAPPPLGDIEELFRLALSWLRGA